MGNLYFLLIFLPKLDFDRDPEMAQPEVRFFLQLNLSKGQMQDVSSLYNFYDIENLRSHLLSSPIKSGGGFSAEELLEKFTSEETFLGVPTLCRAGDSDRQTYAQTLVNDFLLNPPTNNAFLQNYFQFEHIARHTMAFLRAQIKKIQYHAPVDEIPFELADIASWPKPFADLPAILYRKTTSPREIEESVSRWKFHAIEALCENSPPFSLDFLLSYLIRLHLVEQRRELLNTHHLNTLQRMAKASHQL
jgi:hypothetical protein